MRSDRWIGLAAVLLLLLGALPAQSHPLTPIALEVVQTDPTTFVLTWKILGIPRSEEVVFSLEPDCIGEKPVLLATPGAADRDGEQVTRKRSIWVCPAGNEPVLTARNLTEGRLVIGRQHTGAGSSVEMVLSEFRPTWRLVKNSENTETSVGFGAMMAQGTAHLLVGLDHIAFLLCLVVVFEQLSLLVLTTTAFTVGHSLSLICVALGVWNVPSVTAETLIALTLVVMAVRLRVGGRSRVYGRSDKITAVVLCMGFGCIHGLGFGSAMQWTHLSGADLLVHLFGFNLGVEIGQLLVMGLVWILLWPSRKQSVVGVGDGVPPMESCNAPWTPVTQEKKSWRTIVKQKTRILVSDFWRIVRYKWIPDVVGIYGVALTVWAFRQ
ncbi:MAG: HupE/UreJ family protein [Myxococcales bacterium]|nr:HupE/UreJ family protein [Myxococcales bacterium]